MSYVVTWTGATGPERKRASTAAEALRWWTMYHRVATKMVIKDEAGQRVSPEDLAARADRAAATKDGS
jgi:hypothetical protein